MPAKGYRSESTQTILKLALAGKSISEIMEETGLGYFRVHNALKREGIKIADSRKRRVDIDWEPIQKFYNEGHSTRDCELFFGISLSAIFAAAREGTFKTRTIKESLKIGYANGSIVKPPMSDRHRAIMAKSARDRGLGGDRPSNKFEYKGYKLCSSYELRVAKLLDEQGIAWIKPKTSFGWLGADDKSHQYHPDLFLTDHNIYLDPKNSFCIIRDEDKIARVKVQNAVKVVVIPVELIKKWEKDSSTVLTDIISHT